ncbi:MAG: DEAD/DEAH box helicase [Deltaproteobacteria bacterium]|nr:DEAD/DEAH box helicase [Deltaproteobacteria bacterium]
MPSSAPSAPAALAGFGEPARRWFEATFDEPTPVQELGWPLIQAGQHALLVAPTGSGKTLAAFFACLDRLGRPRPADEERAAGVRVLYVSPLKALVYDIERNLRAPRVGIQRMAEQQPRVGIQHMAEQQGGAGVFSAPRVAMRTGDTSQRDRRAQARDPAEILITTPESLYLILGSAQRETLRTVETLIVDEIHALAPTKRGAHLALSLERVAALTGRDPQRIGLSATARPAEAVAGFLGGDRRIEIVDTSRRPLLDLSLHVPVPDMTRPADFRAPLEREAAAEAPGDQASSAEDGTESPFDVATPPLGRLPAPTGDEADTSLWPAIYPELLDAIRAHRSTILFVNSRGLCERLAQRLNELADEDLVRAHHGSIAHEKRKEIEEGLKSGATRAIVATSSLELGIDMGAVDLVLMVESPGAVARGLQRVGRAGHQVGVPSKGRVFPKHRGDLLEAAVVAEGMRKGEVEPLRVPRSPLDVLAQQIVAMASMEGWSVADLAACVARTASYRELSRELLDAVLDMLAGRYPSTEFAELRPRILWDREKDRIEARRGSGKIALLSGGTIPDRGLYSVHMGPEGPRIGELDEEMVHESRPGETITLGASSWRITEITRDRVVVSPAPGEVGRLPFWRGEGPGRPIGLGRALGRFVRELADRCREEGAELHEGRAAGETWLREEYGLDEYAARNLIDYVIDQYESTGALPTDRSITVERFRDELGDWRICLLSPFGSRLHAPWALAIEARLADEKGYDVQTLWSDDGIVLRFADAEELPPLETFLPEPEDVEDLVTGQLERSALFAGQFRENAARALLLPRWRPGGRTPLWTQRLRAQNLLAVAREFPSFPIMLETYRSCLQDVFDLAGLVELLQGIRSRKIRVDEVETRHASPFARSLVFAYTAVYLYQGDTPVAERRAQALTLDRDMLRDLLGQEELRELLDASVIETTEAELQGLADDRRARHADGLHDLLRRVGDLSPSEVAQRCEGDAQAWLDELSASRRAARLKIGGEERWIAAEDAGLVCDALGAAPPAGLPEVFLEPVPGAAERLMARYARVHGPFVTSRIAARYGWLPAQVDAVLRALETRGKLLSGEFHPQVREREWCDPEVLRRIRRRTLARLRGEVAPVESSTLARFLPEWHGIGARGQAEARLSEALDQLEGLPLPFTELESAILPARVPGFDPRQLDELGALGQLAWVGCGSLGDRDGRVALYRRERIGLLAEPALIPEEFGALHRALLDHLEVRGASFFTELALATGEPAGADLLAAVWDLVWAGLVTNDTLAPLRGLAVRAHPRRRGGRALPSAAAGRWSLVTALLSQPTDATARAHARALQLLERHGVASRDVLAVESMAGGWSQLYPVFREMEEMGKLRRGHFVEGYGGAQFAFAGAVDRLRAARQFGDEPIVHLLAACDPANPFGAQVPWPTPTCDQARPRRAAGARVVVVDGELVLFLDRSGRRLWSFPIADETRRDDVLDRALRALRRLFEDRTRPALRLEEIDGGPATQWPDAQRLLQVGFRSGYKGLELERSGPGR